MMSAMLIEDIGKNIPTLLELIGRGIEIEGTWG